VIAHWKRQLSEGPQGALPATVAQAGSPRPAHRLYPYLLHGPAIEATDQVGWLDITCLPVPRGYLYLVAVTDCFSRHVWA